MFLTSGAHQIYRSYRDAKQIGWIDQSVLGIHQDQINLQSFTLQGESAGELEQHAIRSYVLDKRAWDYRRHS